MEIKCLFCHTQQKKPAADKNKNLHDLCISCIYDDFNNKKTVNVHNFYTFQANNIYKFTYKRFLILKYYK